MRDQIFMFIGALIKSVAFSGIMLVIALSLIGGQFPPDFGSLWKSYQGLKELNKMSFTKEPAKAVNTGSEELASASISDTPENDIVALEKINSERRKIGSKMLGGQDEPANNVAPEAATREPASASTPSAVGDHGKIRELEQRIWHLESELENLKDRVNQGTQPSGAATH